MWLLGVQVAAVLVAPLLDLLARRLITISGRVQRVFSWVVLLMVAAHVLPEGWAEAGVAALLAAVAGWAVAFGIERATGAHQGLVATGAAMAFHHVFDGFALGQHAHATSLAPGIVLHTVPVALFAWRLASAQSGRAGVAMLGALVAATALGFGVARSAAAPSEQLAALFACFVAGWLTHALDHGHGEDDLSDDATHERPAA